MVPLSPAPAITKPVCAHPCGMRSREYPFRSPPCRPQRAQARHKAKRTDGRRSSMYIVTCAMNADRSGDATGGGAGLSATGSGSACALRGNVTGGTQHVMADSESQPGAWRSRSAMHAPPRPARRFCLAAPPSHRRSSCTASGAPQARPAHQRHRTGSDDGRQALKPILRPRCCGHSSAPTAAAIVCSQSDRVRIRLNDHARRLRDRARP